jgi:hypothetical protein
MNLQKATESGQPVEKILLPIELTVASRILCSHPKSPAVVRLPPVAQSRLRDRGRCLHWQSHPKRGRGQCVALDRSPWRISAPHSYRTTGWQSPSHKCHNLEPPLDQSLRWSQKLSFHYLLRRKGTGSKRAVGVKSPENSEPRESKSIDFGFNLCKRCDDNTWSERDGCIKFRQRIEDKTRESIDRRQVR